MFPFIPFTIFTLISISLFFASSIEGLLATLLTTPSSPRINRFPDISFSPNQWIKKPNYKTETFLLISFSVFSEQRWCFVRGQGQKSEQKYSTKNFVLFHNHFLLLTCSNPVCLMQSTIDALTIKSSQVGELTRRLSKPVQRKLYRDQ